MEDYPVEISSEGIKIKPEKMGIDKLYHCVYQDKIMLFFKDKNDMLNCYEIEEKELVDQVKQSLSNSGEIEKILEKYIQDKNLNH